MSHYIDFDSLYEELFILQQISLASERYCEREKIGSSLDIGDGEFDTYWGWVKGIISNYLIECAIKTRIVLDLISDKDPSFDLSKADREALEGIKIGVIHEGSFDLSLRETCNKIIHAQKTYPSWVEKDNGDIVFKFWNGCFQLHGKRGDTNWHLELSVDGWAKALSRYHNLLSSSEAWDNIGQDW